VVKRLLPHLALLGCLVIWSANVVVLKVGLTHVRPIPFTAVRFLLAGIVLLAVNSIAGRSVPRPPRTGLLVSAALLGIVANQLTYTLGLHLTSVVDTSLIMGLAPIFTAVVLVAWSRAHVAALQWVGLGLGFAGTIAVVIEAGRAGSGSLLGDLIVVGSPASWAVYLVLIDRERGRTAMSALTPWSMLVAAALLLPAALVFGGPGRDDWGAALPELAYAALLGSALTWTVYFWAMPRVGVTGTAIYTYLQPPLGAVFGAVFLHERIGAGQVLGAALILVAAYLGTWREAMRRPALLEAA
jgi:drug/metabolite transporter (DMT)-like permease